MRNLLGRLHARPAADLDRIAAFWRVPLGSGDRHGRVGALYRVMIDPIAARDVWSRLAAEEAAMLYALATGDPAEEAPTVAELAARLGTPPAEARETALRLYRIGLLAREGDGEQLPVGEVPRLFLPRELSLLFRRVLDEIDLKDRSDTPLSVLIAWLDDGELDEAAEIWGVTTMPGVRRREEIGRRLLRQMADADRVARVARSLGPEARRIWETLLRRPTGGPLALAAAEAAVGSGDDAPTAARFRHALAQLERSLLVWHTYRLDGSRWLFVPADVRNPHPPTPSPLPPLLPLLPIAVREPPTRPPATLAWDLLTLLREMQLWPWPSAEEPSRARLRSLNHRLWIADEEFPPAGYVSFLIELARGEGLLEPSDATADFHLTPALRAWREHSFDAQMDRLRTRWLDHPDWPEAAGRDEVEVWGVRWPEVRRRLMALLVDPTLGLVPERWYALDPLAARIAAREPDLLGRRFTAATARLAGEVGVGGSEEEARAAAIAETVGVELQTAFAWFGIVDVGDSAGEGRGMRLRPGGPAALHTPAAAQPDPGQAAAVTVDSEGAILLHRPSPARVWALSAFADLETLRPAVRFRLSAASLRRALEAGVDASQVTTFLSRQSAGALPAALADRLDAWQRAVRRVRVRTAVVLRPDDPADEQALNDLAAAQDWETRSLPDGEVLVLTGSGDQQSPMAVLRSAGFSPVSGSGPGRTAPRRELRR